MLDKAERFSTFDVKRIERELRKRLADWRALLRRHTPLTRQAVSQLLDGKIVCTPHTEDRRYTFAGRVKFDDVLEASVLTRGVVPVRGFDTLRMPVSSLKLAFEFRMAV